MIEHEDDGRGRIIYAIQAGRRGPVKIGSTNDLESRFRNLQTGNPAPLRLQYVTTEGRETETDLHARFARLRVNDEWYSRKVLRKLRDKEQRKRDYAEAIAAVRSWLKEERPSLMRRIRVAARFVVGR